ncbi:DEAD/DEAH box helicase [Lysinibacillus boronitolerans]|uniref:DEAD/DEAH box helicase n=1 Tax=Lysinibacillus boronitolerans TaxID=309788 RepID=UPI00030E9C2A|nr:ATP-binding domain-containing protein [Lysinibacillus boronitolerans]
MVKIIRGANEKIASAEDLVSFFEHFEDDGFLYLGYPIIGSVEGALNLDAIYISEKYGILAFDLVESTVYEDREDIRDEIYNKLEIKLKDYKALVKKRNLMVEINVVTYANTWNNVDEDDVIISPTHENLKSYLDNIEWDNPEYFNVLLQSIQAVTKIRNNPKRKNVTKEDSKGAILKKLEETIANLDHKQSAAIIETVNGPQRIRGLAGSGKTIVLALKVAYLHVKNRDWKIAVTFNTRSLKKQFEDLITRFTFELSKEEVDWDMVRIIQAWGSPRSEGIYYNVCKEHGIEYHDFNSAKTLFPMGDNQFGGVIDLAISSISQYQKLYDVILVDEAQDFTPGFLKLCYEILKEPKMLIYAYDELQTLNKRSMPTPEEIFGLDRDGNPLVVLSNEEGNPKADIVLETCYRNSRPILATAHALGFGIYKDPMVQMFGNKSLWKEVGYVDVEGQLKDGERVVLQRTTKASPPFLEEHSSIDDIITVKSFESDLEQSQWIANEIEKNITVDELRYQDIMVIHTNPIDTKNRVGLLRKLLFEKGINSHVAGAANPDIFTEENSITFTGIYRAKGNEAAMVYVINGQECYDGPELARKRNILFTAITRSKAWVRITGYGAEMVKLVNEFKKVKENDFKLDFIYPTEDQRRKMNVVNRDMTANEQRFIYQTNHELGRIVSALENEELFLEDIPEEILRSLKKENFR